HQAVRRVTRGARRIGGFSLQRARDALRQDRVYPSTRDERPSESSYLMAERVRSCARSRAALKVRASPSTCTESRIRSCSPLTRCQRTPPRSRFPQAKIKLCRAESLTKTSTAPGYWRSRYTDPSAWVSSAVPGIGSGPTLDVDLVTGGSGSLRDSTQ